MGLHQACRCSAVGAILLAARVPSDLVMAAPPTITGTITAVGDGGLHSGLRGGKLRDTSLAGAQYTMLEDTVLEDTVLEDSVLEATSETTAFSVSACRGPCRASSTTHDKEQR